MSSEAEDELGAIFITAKELVPMSQTLIEMGCTRPPTPIQTDNSTAAREENDTIIDLFQPKTGCSLSFSGI